MGQLEHVEKEVRVVFLDLQALLGLQDKLDLQDLGENQEHKDLVERQALLDHQGQQDHLVLLELEEKLVKQALQVKFVHSLKL